MSEYRLATTEELLRFSKTRRNRTGWLRKSDEDRLDPNGLHLVQQQMLHGDRIVGIRCTVFLKATDKEEPHSAILDFRADEYNSLAVYDPKDFQTYEIVLEHPGTEQEDVVLEEGIKDEQYAFYLLRGYRLAYRDHGTKVIKRTIEAPANLEAEG